MNDFCLIITTAPNPALAKTLAKALLEARLAACVQLLPIQSFYHWQEKIEESAEIALWIKSRSADFTAICQSITRLHSYEVPEIIQLPLNAILPSYGAWLESTLININQSK